MPKSEMLREDLRTDVAMRLKHIRENLGLTRPEIADSMFVSVWHIKDVENARNVSKARIHHIWLVYWDYYYRNRNNPLYSCDFANTSEIRKDLDMVEHYLFDEDYVEDYLYGKED